MVKKTKDSNCFLVLDNIVGSISDCAFLLDSHKKILSLNGQATKFLGYSKKSLKGKKITKVIPELSGKLFNKLTHQKHTELVIFINENETRYIDLCINFLKLEKSTYYLILLRDITKEKNLNKEKEERIINLEFNTQLLVEAIKCTTDMISITDSENRFTYVNKAFLDNYGYSLKEVLGKKPSLLSASSDTLSTPEEIFKTTKDGGWNGELLNRRKDGSVFPIILSTSLITDKSGKSLGYIGIARDITELKAANEKLKQSLLEKETLLKEAYHRVKNNLQVVTSLLHIQSKTITDPATLNAFRESQDRIKMMSLIHEKLYQSNDLTEIDFSEYIHSLTTYLRQSYPVVSQSVDIKIKAQDIYLNVDKAIPCGLIFNEIISNAYKYAFPEGSAVLERKSKKKKEIKIEFSSPAQNKYLLVISDNGIGISENIDFKKVKSMGMVLINTLTQQIDGRVELDRKSGTKYIIRF